MINVKRAHLNQRGFSAHVLMPIAVIAVVAGVGTYLLKGSKAATTTPHTVAAPLGIPDANIVDIPPPIQKGDFKHTVGMLQMMLHYILDSQGIGYTPSTLYYFRTPEENAVKTLQAQAVMAGQSIDIDGKVGPQTWPVILNKFSTALNSAHYSAPPASSFYVDRVAPGTLQLTVHAISPKTCKTMDVVNLSTESKTTSFDHNTRPVGGQTLVHYIDGINVIGARYSGCTVNGVANRRGAWTFENVDPPN